MSDCLEELLIGYAGYRAADAVHRLLSEDWTIGSVIGNFFEADLAMHTSDHDAAVAKLVEAVKAAPKQRGPRQPAKKSNQRQRPSAKEIDARTELAADAPAPALNVMIAEQGLDPTTRALEAWNARVAGVPIVDVAHQMGVSIELAKKLIGEVHSAIYEDLKANVDLNRQLDLARVDKLIKTYLPSACQGDDDAATVVLRCLGHRSKLTGVEAPEGPRSQRPSNVLVWIQNQLPSINRIVDSLPLE